MDFKGKRVLVVGLGESGFAAAKRLKEVEAEVTVVDSGKDPQAQERILALRKEGLSLKTGEHSLQDLEGQELVVLSPGVPDHLPFISETKRREIPLWSEVELAYQLFLGPKVRPRRTKNPIIAVTGTNGKTTTTSLLGEIFKKAGRKVIVAGNIGLPLTEGLKRIKDEEYLIVELSSFQLKNIVKFKPWIGVILNIAPDHLDWHSSFKDYLDAKYKLFLNQTETDFAVVNQDDLHLKKALPKLKSQIVPFSLKSKLEQGTFLKNGEIVFKKGKEEVVVGSKAMLKLKGEHNLENALSAVAVSFLTRVPLPALRSVLSTFKGLPHRLEWVAEIEGVAYYNDSKATNPQAAIQALRVFKEPIILLAGGRNKGLDLFPLTEEIKKRVKKVILFGEAAPELKNLLQGFKELYEAESLKKALFLAKGLAREKEVVLLSPGLSSFDQFKNFEERGKVFKETVERWVRK